MDCTSFGEEAAGVGAGEGTRADGGLARRRPSIITPIATASPSVEPARGLSTPPTAHSAADQQCRKDRPRKQGKDRLVVPLPTCGSCAGADHPQRQGGGQHQEACFDKTEGQALQLQQRHRRCIAGRRHCGAVAAGSAQASLRSIQQHGVQHGSAKEPVGTDPEREVQRSEGRLRRPRLSREPGRQQHRQCARTSQEDPHLRKRKKTRLDGVDRDHQPDRHRQHRAESPASAGLSEMRHRHQHQQKVERPAADQRGRRHPLDRSNRDRRNDVKQHRTGHQNGQAAAGGHGQGAG